MNTTNSKYQTPRVVADSSTVPEQKKKKRLRDYAAEDAAAVRRGRIDLYIRRTAFSRPKHDGSRSRPQLYSQELFWAAQVLRKLEHKALRPLEGYLIGLARLGGYSGPMPDHVTLWRRTGSLTLPPLPKASGKRTIVIDSTGVKIYGPGQWRDLRWDDQIRREYLKFHAVRDAETGEILDWALTRSDGYGSHDGLVGRWMIDNLVSEGLEIKAVAADGAYDNKEFRQAVWRGGGQCLIPPRKNARLSYAGDWQREQEGWEAERDNAILACREDRKTWKESSGYHVRSLAETTFSRHHALFGERLQAKLPDRQSLEVATEVWLLNQTVIRSCA